MVVLRGVRGTSTHDGVVPRVAVTGSFLLVLLSVGMFIRYVAHVANMIRAATIVDSIGREARACLARLPPGRRIRRLDRGYAEATARQRLRSRARGVRGDQ